MRNAKAKPSRDDWSAAIRNLEGNSAYLRSMVGSWPDHSKLVSERSMRAKQLDRVVAYMKANKPC